MNKLEESKAIVAKIIAILEANGVVPSVLHVSNFGNEHDEDRSILFSSAISWLISEGVIRLKGDPIPDDTDDTWHYEVVLTSFGFNALARNMAGTLTLRDQLAEAKSGQRSWSSIGDLIGGVLGGFTKTIGNG